MQLMDRPLSYKEIRKIFERAVTLDSLGEFPVGQMFCPFHDNHNTESAYIHRNDDDGVQRIFCYNCRKQFTSFDYYKEILGQNPLTYILENLNRDEIEAYLRDETELQLSMVDEIDNMWIDSNENLVAFINNVYLIKKEDNLR